MNKKEQIEQMEAAKAIVQTAIDARQETYDDHTEDWQESDKGQAYLAVTEKLEEVLDELDNAKDELA